MELETREEDVRYGVLDSACWSRNGVTGPTISEELNTALTRKGYVAFMPSSKGRMEGANAFKQRLIGNELQDIDETLAKCRKWFRATVDKRQKKELTRVVHCVKVSVSNDS